MDKHLRSHRRLFDNRAERREGTLHEGEAALFMVGVINGTNDFRVDDLGAGDIFRRCGAGDGDSFTVYEAGFKQLFHQSLYAARAPEVLNMMRAAGAH